MVTPGPCGHCRIPAILPAIRACVEEGGGVVMVVVVVVEEEEEEEAYVDSGGERGSPSNQDICRPSVTDASDSRLNCARSDCVIEMTMRRMVDRGWRRNTGLPPPSPLETIVEG